MSLLPPLRIIRRGVHWFLDTRTGEVFPIVEGIEEEKEIDLEAEPERFIVIEPLSSHVCFEMMADFVETLPEESIRRALDRALGKKRPFRRFKDELADFPETAEQWYRFQEQVYMAIIQEWLDDHSLEITLVPRYI